MTIAIWNEGQATWKSVLERTTHVKEMYTDDMLLPKNQVKMKYLALYSRYIELFSSKYKNHRMNENQIREFCRLSLKYADLLRFPKYYFLTIAIMETDLDPFVVGPSKEKGICQQHRFGMGVVYEGLHDLKSSGYLGREWAKELDPMLRSHNGLRGNPIASLKCQILIAFFNKNKFDGNAPWWVSGAHWGWHKLINFYTKEIKMSVNIISYFVTKKGRWIACRPRWMLTYWKHFIKIHDKLSLGRIDIYNEVKREVEKYRTWKRRIYRKEKQYIDSVNYINKLTIRVARGELFQKKILKQLGRYKRYHNTTKDFVFNMRSGRKKIYLKYIKKKKDYNKAYTMQEKLMIKFEKLGRKIYNIVKVKK